MYAFIYDLETTSTDTQQAKIVQIGVLVIGLENMEVKHQYKTLVDPEEPIPADATAVHGITDEDVKGAPLFSDVMDYVQRMLAKCEYIGGYNNYAYDDVILMKEFARCGIETDLDAKKNIDVFKLVNHLYPRTLSGMYKLFTGKEMDNAHDAMADVEATIEIYKSIEVPDIEALLTEIYGSIVDRSGFLMRNEQGEAVFTSGKHKGQSIVEVARINRQYLEWIAGERSTFAKDTKKVALNALNGVYP